jgi:hypothetical protein
MAREGKNKKGLDWTYLPSGGMPQSDVYDPIVLLLYENETSRTVARARWSISM